MINYNYLIKPTYAQGRDLRAFVPWADWAREISGFDNRSGPLVALDGAKRVGVRKLSVSCNRGSYAAPLELSEVNTLQNCVV